jgi:hypothetical protein
MSKLPNPFLESVAPDSRPMDTAEYLDAIPDAVLAVLMGY